MCRRSVRRRSSGAVVGHNLACVFVCSEVHAGNFVEAELLGPADLYRVIPCCSHRQFGQDFGNVIRSYGLYGRRGKPEAVSIRRHIDHAADELEELRGMEDGIVPPRCPDEIFLHHLGVEIIAFDKARRSHH